MLSIAYLCYCLLPAVRKPFAAFYRSHDPVFAGFALLMLLIPFMSGAGLLFFASGEVMSCDTQELCFAKRRTWGRWHRFRFPAKEVRQMRRTSRGAGSRSRYYTVLTFQHRGRTYDMLEDLDPESSEQILKACKALGLDAIIVVDQNAAMNRDIAARGWAYQSATFRGAFGQPEGQRSRVESFPEFYGGIIGIHFRSDTSARTEPWKRRPEAALENAQKRFPLSHSSDDGLSLFL